MRASSGEQEASGTARTQSITYLRCSVTDSAFNAFNNNDMSESTSVLYCRVENINNCFWEGAGAFHPADR